MDRVGFGIKLEQMCRLFDKGEFAEAAKVADTMEWRKVKRWSELSAALDVYEKAGRLKDARNICVYAYNRNLGGKRLLYKLTELSIAINDLEEADELYREFVDEAPKDTARYVLLYKLNVARGASAERLIEILEEYKSNELEESYEYELASLYAKVGRIEDCVRECDDLILWFNEGEFVEKALELKKRFAPLTRAQQVKYEYFQEARRAGIDPHAEVEPEYEEEQDAVVTETFDMNVESVVAGMEPQRDEMFESVVERVRMGKQEETVPAIEDEPFNEDDIKVEEKNYEIYDTQNIQAELAKSMSIIMSSMEAEKERNVFKADIKEVDMNVSVVEPLEAEVDDEGEEEILVADLDEEIVDEPTKEIRINKRHLNTVPATTQPIPTIKPEAVVAEPTPVVVTVPTTVAESVAETKETEPEVMEGQIGLLDWLSQEEEKEESVVSQETKVISDVIEAVKAEVAATVVEEKNIVVKEEPVDTVELAINELNKQLLEEEERNAKAKAKEEAVEEVTEEPAVEEVVEEVAEEPVVEEVVEEVAEEPVVEEVVEEVAEEPVAEEVVEEVAEEPVAEEVVEETTEPEPQVLKASDVDLKSQYTTVMQLPVIEDTRELNELNALGTIEPKVEYNTMELIAPLTPEERKYVRKYLCMEGMEHSINTVIKCKKLDRPDGTSARGNIVITGRGDLDKTGFAINLFKAMHANDDIRQLEIAKTTAAILNKKGVAASAQKIKGTTLIIENAGMLMPEVVRELKEFMKGDTGSMLVILTGEDFSIKRIFLEEPEFGEMFPHTIELKKMSVNDLVIIAKEYAREKGYSIDEKALLKVYLLIDELQSKNQDDETDGVKKIVDDAIAKCGNKGKGLFGRKSGGLIPLKEKNFM